MGREVVNIRSSDIVVIVGGSTGTLGELAIAYDEGKLIGVLTGTGGISVIVKTVLEACNKDTGARVLYNDDARQLVEQLLQLYRTEHFRHPSVFCRGDSLEFQPQQIGGKGDSGGRRDVVCGMLVAAGAAAARRNLHGNEYVFCSLRCAEMFDAQPADYLESGESDVG